MAHDDYAYSVCDGETDQETFQKVVFEVVSLGNERFSSHVVADKLIAILVLQPPRQDPLEGQRDSRSG